MSVAVLAFPQVGNAGWTAPKTLSSPDADALEVRVAANVRGRHVAVWWRRLDGYNSTVEAAVGRAGGVFGPPATLSDPEPKDGGARPFITTGHNSDPDVTVDPWGSTIAVWIRRATDGPPFMDRVRAIVLAPGRTTGQRVNVSAETTGASHPAALVDGAGNATVFWTESDERVHWALRPAGGAFASPGAISNPAARVEWPDYAVAANGDAAVVWSSNGRVLAAVRPSGGGFGPGVQINAIGSSAIAPEVAMDRRGNALAVWVERQSDYADGEVKAAFRPAGGGFGAPRTLAEVFYTGTYEAAVGMSPQGEATIAWAGGALDPSFDAGVTAVLRSPGGEFGGLQRVSSVAAEEAPQVAYDRGGTTYVVWRHYDDRIRLRGRILAAVRPAGASRHRTTYISTRGANVWLPDLATGAAGDALAGWPRGSSTFSAQVAQHLAD
jgi:hypothetical protein